MGDVTRVLSGLEDFEVTGAVEAPGGGLEVSVRVARPDAACPRCGTFSSRVKEYRSQTELTGHRGRRATRCGRCAGTCCGRGGPHRRRLRAPRRGVQNGLLGRS